jgi:hypothetical protein
LPQPVIVDNPINEATWVVPNLVRRTNYHIDDKRPVIGRVSGQQDVGHNQGQTSEQHRRMLERQAHVAMRRAEYLEPKRRSTTRIAYSPDGLTRPPRGRITERERPGWGNGGSS